MNNKYTIAAITIIEIVITITLITYFNFNISDAFGDHGEGFEDTYENWYEDSKQDYGYEDSKQDYGYEDNKQDYGYEDIYYNNHNKNKKNNQKDFMKNLINNY